MTLYEQLRNEAEAETRTLVHSRVEGDRAVVTLDDPGRLNALSPALNVQLGCALGEVTADPAVRSVTLTGTDPAFCAGGDLRMMRDGNASIRDGEDPADTAAAWRWIRRQFGGVVRTIANSDQLFIAAVNGPAAGVGMAFALACDVVLASDRAVLVPAFGGLGLVPEVGTSWLLTRRLGYHAALALYVRGEPIEPGRARELGLVGEVHDHSDLLGAATEWASRASTMPQHALEMTKPLLRSTADVSWEESLRLEEFAEANCFSTVALGNATAGFLSKGNPE